MERDKLEAMSDLEKVAISTKEAPAAIGPYSQAIWVGDLLFASGQVALDPATGQLVAGGITEQTTQVLKNVKAILHEAGLHMHNVVKTTVFLKSMGDFAAMNEVYAKLDTLDKQIWGKLVCMEANRRTAKAYLRHPVITVDGSRVEFDGFRWVC